MTHRRIRFAAWIVAVALIGVGPLITRLGIPARYALAGAWTLAHLSAIVWMLARPARGSIRLPVPVSEVFVLVGTPLLAHAATGRWGAATLLAGAFLLINHAGFRPLAFRRSPALGNPWRLVPSLWHPALWLVVLNAPGAAAAWTGVGLVPCAHAASVLTRSPSRAVRAVAWTAWLAVGVMTVVQLSG